jgi:hypothetical protein
VITPEVGKAYYVGNPEISSSLDILKVDAITESGDVIGREVDHWRPQLIKRDRIIAEFTLKKPSIWKRMLGEGEI